MRWARDADGRHSEGAVVHEAQSRHGVGESPQTLSQREAEVDCISGTVTALPTLRTTGARLDAGFDLYETGLLARTQVETPRIKEVSQWVRK